jgi:hypothetical protein
LGGIFRDGLKQLGCAPLFDGGYRIDAMANNGEESFVIFFHRKKRSGSLAADLPVKTGRLRINPHPNFFDKEQ